MVVQPRSSTAEAAATVQKRNEALLLNLYINERRIQDVTANLSALFDIYNNEYDAIAGFNRKVLRAVKPLSSLANDYDAVTAMVHPSRNDQASTTVI